MKPQVFTFFILIASVVNASQNIGSDTASLDSMILIIICILLSIIFLSLFVFIKRKRKDLKYQVALIEAEKKETQLQLQAKEKQMAKSQIERYEALSDFHLTEMELIGKTKDVEQQRKDNGDLYQVMKCYRQKVEAYELKTDKEKDANYNTLKVIVEEIKHIINKQPESISKNEYLQNINLIDKSFIEFLRKKSEGNVSISNMKYCICFAIGMSITDVAHFFCIEPSSVHMIRYRLRKKYRLGNDDDLGLFFQQYAFS